MYINLYKIQSIFIIWLFYIFAHLLQALYTCVILKYNQNWNEKFGDFWFFGVILPKLYSSIFCRISNVKLFENINCDGAAGLRSFDYHPIKLT